MAFPLVDELLKLNKKLGNGVCPAIEIVIISKNHPDCGIRIRHSLKHYGMDLRRAAFTGGQTTLPYLRAFTVDLFLSKEESAVRDALAAGISAGLIHGGPEVPEPSNGPPIFAFDGDSVLFSGAADQAYRDKSMEGFEAFEFENLATALPPGPLHKFALALEALRAGRPIDDPPFRIALVTARALTYSHRPLRTLRESGIRIDQSFFLDGMSKGILLSQLKPLIFFDDNLKNCIDACASTPTVRIPVEEPATLTLSLSSGPARTTRNPERFLHVCKLVLKKTFDQHEPTLRLWQEEKLNHLPDDVFESITDEFERSAKGTPSGRQRRAAGAQNDDFIKVMSFLENSLRKHSIQAP